MDKDIAYGLKSEASLLLGIKNTFGEGYEKIQETYHPYDFQDGDNYIELKTRRCKHNTYPTTMIGYNKVKYAQDRPTCKFKFLFKFEDGLYQHDFQHTKEYPVSVGGRCDRGRTEFNKYVFIPINDLVKVS
jgi:hypothetical protein